MYLNFVDAQELTFSVEVSDEAHARRVFDQSLRIEPWIAATLREKDGSFVTSFLRLEGVAESHPSITPAFIEDAISARSDARRGDELLQNEKPWRVPGLCHEVSEYIEQSYGLARTSGTIMARDLVTPICLHYWNVLPDMTIVDMTADQLQEGFDFRIIPPGHPDWYRYQPEYECVEDLVDDKGGKGYYSDELIDFILETAERVGRKRAGLRDYINAPAASVDLMAKLKPYVTEHLQVALESNEPQSPTVFNHLHGHATAAVMTPAIEFAKKFLSGELTAFERPVEDTEAFAQLSTAYSERSSSIESAVMELAHGSCHALTFALADALNQSLVIAIVDETGIPVHSGLFNSAAHLMLDANGVHTVDSSVEFWSKISRQQCSARQMETDQIYYLSGCDESMAEQALEDFSLIVDFIATDLLMPSGTKVTSRAPRSERSSNLEDPARLF